MYVDFTKNPVTSIDDTYNLEEIILRNYEFRYLDRILRIFSLYNTIDM